MLTIGSLREILVPLPPPREQGRIVSKIGALRTRSQLAKEALDAIPQLLERFRQSVLAAAFRGDLTAEWRAKNPDVEPASELLKRIRAERRRRWEESELAKMKSKGKPPTDDRWKAKYEEPAPANMEKLSELPDGWTWASADELCEPGRPIIYGIIKAGPDFPGGVPYVRVTEVAAGVIHLNDLPRCDPVRAALFKRSILKAGDLLVSKDGTIGKVVLVPPELEGGNINQHVLRFAPHRLVDRQFLMRAVETPASQSWMKGEQKGIGLQGVNVEDFRRMPVPLAPLAEQPVVAQQIEQHWRRLKQLASSTMAARAGITELDSAILAKAFRGELVPQDPDDEPASALLARVAERAAPAPAPVGSPPPPPARRSKRGSAKPRA